MKKILSLILLLSLVLTFAVSCNNQTEPTGSSDPTSEPTAAPTEAPATSAIIEPTIAEGTWGAAFWNDFNAAVDANKGASADVIANTIHASASGSGAKRDSSTPQITLIISSVVISEESA